MPELPGLEIVALADNNPEALAKSRKILAGKKLPAAREFGGDEGYKAMCDAGLADVVYNCTPRDLHVAINVYAMDRGLHAFTEVPGSMTIDGCWETVEACERNRVHCMMLENCCYGEYEMLALNLVNKGILGEKSRGFRVPLPAFIPIQVLSALVALCLIVGLVGTGVAEWCTYININKNAIMVDTNSEVTNWIKSKTSPSDVFLTPMWFTNRFFLAGRPDYYGWPYYAWSAGHDTYKRDEIYFWLVGGCNNNIDEFVRYCKEREIKYLLYDPEFNDLMDPNGEPAFNAPFFANNLKQVAYFPDDNNTIIYQIY